MVLLMGLGGSLYVAQLRIEIRVLELRQVSMKRFTLRDWNIRFNAQFEPEEINDASVTDCNW